MHNSSSIIDEFDTGWDFNETLSETEPINNVKHDRLERPCPKPIPPKPIPPKPIPPKPIPPKPTPQGELKIGGGLQLDDDNVLSVQLSQKNNSLMTLDTDGISIQPLLKHIEFLRKQINYLLEHMTNAESEINELQTAFRPKALAESIVKSSNSFETNVDGKVVIKTNNGVTTDPETGELIVNYDSSTIGVVDNKLSAISDDWNSQN